MLEAASQIGRMNRAAPRWAAAASAAVSLVHQADRDTLISPQRGLTLHHGTTNAPAGGWGASPSPKPACSFAEVPTGVLQHILRFLDSLSDR